MLAGRDGLIGDHFDTADHTRCRVISGRCHIGSGVQGRVGSLAQGTHADFVAFPVTGDDPLREVLEKNVEPNAVWIAGAPVARERR